jgi:hypothetical protein
MSLLRIHLFPLSVFASFCSSDSALCPSLSLLCARCLCVLLLCVVKRRSPDPIDMSFFKILFHSAEHVFERTRRTKQKCLQTQMCERLLG